MPAQRDHNTLRAYEQEVSARSVATPQDGAVFFSGSTKSGEDNRLRAEDFVKGQPAGKSMLIDQTPCGVYLTHQELYQPQINQPTRYPGERSPLTTDDADKVWDHASERFAKEASGHAVCFVDGARSDRSFRGKEFPALLANEKITDVNGISRSELQKDPKTAFGRVEEKARELPPLGRASEQSKETPRGEIGSTKERSGSPRNNLPSRVLSREAAGQPAPSKERERGRAYER